MSAADGLSRAQCEGSGSQLPARPAGPRELRDYRTAQTHARQVPSVQGSDPALLLRCLLASTGTHKGLSLSKLHL